MMKAESIMVLQVSILRPVEVFFVARIANPKNTLAEFYMDAMMDQ